MQVVTGPMEMELSGSPAELRALAGVIRSGAEGCALDPGADPVPYARALSCVDVARTEGKASVVVAADGATPEIRGGARELDILAWNIEVVTETDEPSYHVHIEYLPGDHYLSERSEPLVVIARHAG